MLTTREIAITIWLGAAIFAYLIWVIASEKQRPPFLALVKAALSPKIVTAAAVTLASVAVGTAILGAGSLWNVGLLKEAILFGFSAALPLTFNSELMVGKATLASRTASMLGPATFIEILAGLDTFPLWLELLLVPVTVIISVAAVATKRPRLRAALQILLSVTGLTLLGFSVVAFLVSAQAADWESLGRTVIYIVCISIWTVVYAIVFGVWVTFADKIHWLSFNREPGMLPRPKGVVAIVAAFAGQTARLGATPPVVIMQMNRTTSIRAAVKVARDHLHEREEKAFAVQAKANALLEFADVTGVDLDGKQLDRREFVQTCAALDWLATCMIGQWDRFSKFRLEVLDIAGPYDRQGLPEEDGIEMRVDASGQRWYAYRRTITGWVFAVGGNSHRDQWNFEGPEAPTGYPSAQTGWVQYGGTLNWEY